MSRVSDYWRMGGGYAEIFVVARRFRSIFLRVFLTDVCSEQREGASARTGLGVKKNE